MSKEEIQSVEEKNDNKEQTGSGISLLQILYDWLGTGVMSLVVIFLVMTFFYRQVTVNGNSMNDTLQNQDRLIVQSFMYEPKCGDIVVVTHGRSLNEPIIKRVIATGGQTLRIDYENSQVIVDGVVIKEDYIKGLTVPEPNPTKIPAVIPEGYVFVMGDNREDSLDSRSSRVGLIPVENIVGKAIMRMFPFDTFGWL